MRKIIVLALAVWLAAVPAAYGEIFKWVDSQGNVHFSDSLSGVPPQYRDQVETKKYRKSTPSTVRSESGGGGYSSHGESSSASQEGLKRFEVKYKAYEGAARRIIIPVTFNGSVTVDMLLDTGAPGLIISPSLADRLGLFDKSDGKVLITAGGIGGTIPAILTIIDKVEVAGAASEFVPTKITQSISGSFEGLVGMDFMANYSINIDTRGQRLIFEQLPPRANMPAGHDRAWWMINFFNFSRLRSNWKNYMDKVNKLDSKSSKHATIKKLAKKQYEEANKLFSKLERYASYNSVPMHWRKY